MAIYDTRYGLTQPEVNYLNQGLPSISGIFSNTPTTTSTNNTTSQPNNSVGLTPEQLALLFPQYNLGNDGGGGENDNTNNTIGDGSNFGINSLSDAFGALSGNFNVGSVLGGILGGPLGAFLGNKAYGAFQGGDGGNGTTSMSDGFGITAAGNFTNQFQGGDPGTGGPSGGTSDGNSPDGGGSYCFDPKTPIQMADGSTKEIKNIQLGDDTKGGEVTGVFQFKASDEIHDYKGVTVAGSHYVKEEGRFIMVKDSPLAVKIDKIPVVYSLDTSDRRIFIKDIEFADYNGDGVAKNFLNNAGVDLTGFNKEVLRQVEQRLL
jgi:hypothetical protein